MHPGYIDESFSGGLASDLRNPALGIHRDLTSTVVGNALGLVVGQHARALAQCCSRLGSITLGIAANRYRILSFNRHGAAWDVG